MKTKEVLKLIFVNPFEKIAGWQALGLGLIAVMIAALIGSYNGVYFDGAFDFHPTGNPYSLWLALELLGIGLASIIIMFLLAGVFFSKNFRVIDVIGTTTLAKIPYLFLVLTGFIRLPEILNDANAITENPYEIFSVSFIVFILLATTITIWLFALHYHAFKVSLNIRKNLRVVVFIFALLFAEILSKVIIYYIF